MPDTLRYRHFDRVETPILVVSEDRKVVYRNRAFKSFDPGFCTSDRLKLSFLKTQGALLYREDRDDSSENSRFSGGFSELYHRYRTVEFCFGDSSLPAMLLYDRCPEGTFLILVFAPFLQGNFVFSSACGSVGQPLFKDIASLPKKEKLSETAELFIRPYAAAIGRSFERLKERFALEDACLFLNRFSQRTLNTRGCSVLAKCTGDCLILPLDRFAELMAVFACLSVLFSESAVGKKLEIIITCRRERPVFLFSFGTNVKPDGGRFQDISDLLPERKTELHILSAVLCALDWNETVLSEGNFVTVACSAKDRLPTQFFKSPAKEEKLFVLERIEMLLTAFGAERE